MKKISMLALLCSASLCSVAMAYEPALSAFPDSNYSASPGFALNSSYQPTPTPVPLSPQPVPATEVYAAPIMPVAAPLFPAKVRGERNINCRAVPLIVSVPNPCYDPCIPCCDKCVNVQICVPPCETPCVSFRRHGDKLVYCYGDEAVSVTVRRNDILVAYH
jgi:hypothetical protein